MSVTAIFRQLAKGGCRCIGNRSSRWRGYVMVKVRAWLVPPLVQPRLPEFPLGVLMVTLAVPGPVMNAVVSVTCNWELLRTCVLRVVPLITTTEDEIHRRLHSLRIGPTGVNECNRDFSTVSKGWMPLHWESIVPVAWLRDGQGAGLAGSAASAA